MSLPVLQPQEIPFGHLDSRYRFRPSPQKPFLATPPALALYGEAIPGCLALLQRLAAAHGGLDYLQVFRDPQKPEAVWFIEDDGGGAITALLPSDY